jgi:hypothetical protein
MSGLMYGLCICDASITTFPQRFFTLDREELLDFPHFDPLWG